MAHRRRLGAVAELGSAGVLALAVIAQALIQRKTGSSALLSDAAHNFGDVLAAVLVTVAVLMGSPGAERRAARLVALIVLGSAVFAGCEAIMRFGQPGDLHEAGMLAAGGLAGIAGNGIAGMIRARVGRRIGNAALLAEAMHARADVLLSGSVVLSSAAVWLGAPVLDPVVGLVFALWMAWVAVRTWSGDSHHGHGHSFGGHR